MNTEVKLTVAKQLYGFLAEEYDPVQGKWRRKDWLELSSSQKQVWLDQAGAVLATALSKTADQLLVLGRGCAPEYAQWLQDKADDYRPEGT